MSLEARDDPPTAAEVAPEPQIPLTVALLVCECGEVGWGYAHVRCGRNRRRNMRYTCPTALVHYRALDDNEVPD